MRNGARISTGAIAGALLATVLVALLAACSGSSASSAPVGAVGSEPPTTAAESSAASEPPASPTEVASASAPASAPAASKKPRPSIDAQEIAAVLTSSITLLDVADTDFSATVTYIDPSSGTKAALGTYVVGASEHLSESVPAGTYQIDFRLPSTARTTLTCTIAVKDGGAFTFVAVPGAIAVSRGVATPASAADLFVATSSLCKA